MAKKKTARRTGSSQKLTQESKLTASDSEENSETEMNITLDDNILRKLTESDPTAKWVKTTETQDNQDEPELLSKEEQYEIFMEAMVDDDIQEELKLLALEDAATTHRDDGLRKEVAELAHSGTKKKTRRVYRKHWNLYKKYTASCDGSPTTEINAMHFFVDMLAKKKFGIGSVWSIYACVNNGLQREYGVSANDMKELRKLLVNITKYYQPKRARIIKEEEIKQVFTEVFDPNDDFDLQAIISISLMFYGLLRQNEAHAIKVQDVTVVEEKRIIHVNFPNPTKSRARGFAFTIPTHLYDVYIKYIKQLRAGSRAELADSQFLKNHTKKGLRFQNMGKDKHGKFLKRIQEYFGWETKCLTTHSWRRSAATILANSGISVIGLKRAGRWRNLETAEHYLEHSAPVLEDRMNRLDQLKTGDDEEEWGVDGEKVISMVTVSLIFVYMLSKLTYSQQKRTSTSRDHDLHATSSFSGAKRVKTGNGDGCHFGAAGGVNSGSISAEEGSKMNPIDVEGKGISYYNCTFHYGSGMYGTPPTQYGTPPTHHHFPHAPTLYQHPAQSLPPGQIPYPTTYRHTVETTSVSSPPNFDIIPDYILASMNLPGLVPTTNQNRRSPKKPPKNPYLKKTQK